MYFDYIAVLSQTVQNRNRPFERACTGGSSRVSLPPMIVLREQGWGSVVSLARTLQFNLRNHGNRGIARDPHPPRGYQQCSGLVAGYIYIIYACVCVCVTYSR